MFKGDKCEMNEFLFVFLTVDDANDGKDNDDMDGGQYDDHGAGGSMQDDSGRNGGPSRMDVDEVDRPYNNRNRNNFNSGNDGGYGMRETAALIVNSNLLPFVHNLRDAFR